MKYHFAEHKSIQYSTKIKVKLKTQMYWQGYPVCEIFTSISWYCYNGEEWIMRFHVNERC